MSDGTIPDPKNTRELALDTIARVCDKDPSTLDLAARAADLGIDSLALTAIAALFEARCEVQLTEQQMLQLYQAAYLHEIAATLCAAGQ